MKKRYISLGEIEAIIELYTFVNDEWGGMGIWSES